MQTLELVQLAKSMSLKLISKEIKPVVIAIIKLCLSEGISESVNCTVMSVSF